MLKHLTTQSDSLDPALCFFDEFQKIDDRI